MLNMKRQNSQLSWVLNQDDPNQQQNFILVDKVPNQALVVRVQYRKVLDNLGPWAKITLQIVYIFV